MKKLILGVFFLYFTFASCHHDEVRTQQTAVTEYLPLQIGNYWIYKTYRIDTTGQETYTGQRDSIFISGDTVINNKTYQVFREKLGNSSSSRLYRILRDSSNYLVNNFGHIFLSTDNFSDILRTKVQVRPGGDTTYVIKYIMVEPAHSITVDAGTFDQILNFQGDADIYSFGHVHRTVNHYYAKDIGLVQYNWFFLSSPDNYEVRLERYHVQ